MAQSTTKSIVVELRLEDKGAVALLGQLKAEVVKLTTERNKLQATVRKGNDLTEQEQQRLGVLSASIRNANVQIRELDNNLSGASAAGLRFRDKMADAAKAGLGAFGLNILSVTGAVFGAISVFKDAINTLGTFDQALAKVSALGGDYAKNIGQIAEVTKTIGIQFGFTAVQSVSAVEELAKAGVALKDIMGGGLQGTLTLAAAGELEVGDAAELAAIAMTQFGLKGEDIAHVADVLTAGAIKALGSVGDLGEALKFIGPIASALNVSLDQTVGTLALFAQSGIKGEQAGTGLRGVLSSLTSPSADATKALKELGIITKEGANQLFDAQGKFAGLANLAEQLKVALNGMTDAQREEALGRIFGNKQVTAATVLYKAGAVEVDKWTAAVNDSGIAAEVAAKKTDNLIGDQNKLKGAYDAVILSAGPVNSALRFITQGLTQQLTAIQGARNGWEALALIMGGNSALAIAAQQAQKFKESLDPANRSLEQLGRDLEKAQTQQKGFLDVGKTDVAAEFQPKIDGLKKLIAAREHLAKITGEGTAAVVLDAQKNVDANGAVIVSLGDLKKQLAAAKKDRDALNSTDKEALATADANIAALDAQIKSLQGTTKATKEQTQAKRDQLALEKELTKAEDLRAQGAKTPQQQAEAKVTVERDTRIEQAHGDTAILLRIEADFQAQILAIREKFGAEQTQQQDKLDAELLKRKAVGLQQQLSELEKTQKAALDIAAKGGGDISALIQQQEQDRAALKQQIREAEFAAKLTDFDTEYQQAVDSGANLFDLTATQQKELNDMVARFRAEDAASRAEDQGAELEAALNLKDAKLGILQAEADGVAALGDILVQASEKGSAAAKLGLALQKAAAIASVIISTEQAEAVITAFYPIGTPLTPAAIASIASLRIREAIQIATIAATAILGFDKGGKVEKNGRVNANWGTPVRRSNGDNVLATLKEDELVMNEPQQEEAKRLYGDDIFRRLGIPGFVGGGHVRHSPKTVLTPVFSGINAPRPTTSDLLTAELAAETRAINFAPVVSVSEINNVQGRVKVIESLSSA